MDQHLILMFGSFFGALISSTGIIKGLEIIIRKRSFTSNGVNHNNDILDKLDKISTRIEQRFNALEVRLDAMDKRISRIDERVSRLESK